MIYAKIKELGNYKGQSKNLDIAIDYLMNLDKASLVMGKTEICGDQVFINVMEYETKAYEEGAFEAHKKYIDIQMLLEGRERIMLTHIEDLEVTTPYDEDKDVMFLMGEVRSECILGDEYVCVCFPEDGHMPGISLSNTEKAPGKKLVVKIHVD